MKQAVVSALDTDDNNIRRAVALCVASIAAIEIPRGEWLDVIQLMVGTAENDNINVRLSSLQTLGFLADELESRYFNDQQKSFIIQAIVKNIQNDPSAPLITKTSVKAFYSALHLADVNFKVQAERDFIMQRLFQVSESQDDEIQEITMQIFVDLCKQFYDFVSFYFQEIFTLTQKFSQCPEQKVSAQAIEIWTTLAEEESER